MCDNACVYLCFIYFIFLSFFLSILFCFLSNEFTERLAVEPRFIDPQACVHNERTYTANNQKKKMKIKQFSCHSFFPMIHGVVVATIYFFPPIMHRHFSSPACVVYPLCNGPTDIERLHQEGEKRKKEEEEKKELTLRLWLWALSVYKVAVFRLPEENVERGGYCCVFWRRGKIQRSSTAQRTEIIPLPLPSMTTQRLVCLVWPPFLCSTVYTTA